MYKQLIWISLFTIIIIYIIFCSYGYPLLNGDPECFLPVAYQIRFHKRLINPFYNAGFIEGNKFLFYPPFYPFFLSLFILKAKAIYVYVSLTIVNVFIFLVINRIVEHLLKTELAGKKLQAIDICFIVFFFISVCSFVAPGNSRPEILCYLILSLTICLLLEGTRYRYFFIGILLSFGVLTSPVFGIYLCILILLYLAYSSPHSIKVFTSIFFGGFSVLIIFLCFYPYPVVEMIKAIKVHSYNVIVNRNESFNLSSFLRYYLFASNGAFIVLVFAVAFIIAVRKIFINNKSIKTKYLCAALLLLLLFLILYFAFRNFAMYYYLSVLAPLLLIVIFYKYVTETSPRVKLFLLGTVILASVSFLRLSLNFSVTFLTTKFNIYSVDKKLSKYANMRGKTIGVSPSLWIFFSGTTLSQPDTYYIYNKAKNFDYIILQQAGTGIYSPPKIEGYDLIENYFENRELRVLGIKTASYSPFYQYAAYKKNEKNSFF